MRALQREVECVEASDVEAIVVDSSGLTFLDSNGLRLVVLCRCSLARRLQAPDVAAGAASVQRVFAFSGFEDRLPFAD